MIIATIQFATHTLHECRSPHSATFTMHTWSDSFSAYKNKLTRSTILLQQVILVLIFVLPKVAKSVQIQVSILTQANPYNNNKPNFVV